jgi:hypothetical protein
MKISNLIHHIISQEDSILHEDQSAGSNTEMGMHRDNTSFLAKKSITKMDHPPHSPDLAPCNFWLLKKLRNALKRQ